MIAYLFSYSKFRVILTRCSQQLVCILQTNTTNFLRAEFTTILAFACEKTAGNGFNIMIFNLFMPPRISSERGRFKLLSKNNWLLSVGLNPVFPAENGGYIWGNHWHSRDEGREFNDMAEMRLLNFSLGGRRRETGKYGTRFHFKPLHFE